MTEPDPREPYGRLVHETRLAHEADQAAAEGRARFMLGSWDERSDAQHELDMRIGSAVAARAIADAKLRNERLEFIAVAIACNVPAIRRSLVDSISRAEWESEAKPFRAALNAIGGEET